MSTSPSYKDLRGWLDQVDAYGELRRIEGIDTELELGDIAALVSQSPDNPAVLCDRLKDRKPGYRVLLNSLGSKRRLALSLSVAPPEDQIHLVWLWKEKLKSISAIPPAEVRSGAVTANQLTGNRVDLRTFPTPRWHELDGGQYIGTACCVITKSPEDDWVNFGTYRAMVQGPAAIGFFAEPGRHGRLHRELWWKMGKPCPVAVVLGCDPLLFIVSSLNLPAGTSELEYAGGIKGEPIEIIKDEASGLPIPASAECVLLGDSSEGDTLPEGPFGEWTGYYGSERSPQPVIRVKSIVFRDDPIVFGRPPIKPPSSQAGTQGLMRAALVWNQLEAAGIPSVNGVWLHDAGGGSLFSVICISQKYAGHATQAALVASQCGGGIRNGRFVVVVDDDIDPSDIHDVLWAVSTRCDPARSFQTIRRSFSGPLDTGVLPGEVHGSRMIIDACKPYERLRSFPISLKIHPQRLAEAKKKWGFLLDR